MDHATAILEDAGKAIDKTVDQARSTASESSAAAPIAAEPTGGDDGPNGDNSRKRKANYPDYSIRQGGRGRGRGVGDNKRHKKGDMGRGEYL